MMMVMAEQAGTRSRLIRPTLSGLRIPEHMDIRRKMPLPEARRDEKYVSAFDSRTLIYDAVESADRISLFCPRLLNLWPLLRDGLRLDGAPVRVRRHRYLRFERLDLPKHKRGDLSVDIAGAIMPFDVNRAQSELFAGLNTLIAMVKDTPSQWIVDWANYHASAHDTQGLVLTDNGSDPAKVAQMVARLESETALQRIAVVSAPFPYGGTAGGRFIAPAKYLQVAMLNLLQARFLTQARGILSVDVDEFVQPLSKATIYDLAQASRLGCVSFAGAWAFAENTHGPQAQRDHTHTDPDQPSKNPKWCLRPGSVADRFPLAVHRPAGPLFQLTQTKKAAYWHFRATNTGWKKARFKTGKRGVIDQDLSSAVEAHLSDA
jgi:hypothetical protein